jgi:hypothetical protein
MDAHVRLVERECRRAQLREAAHAHAELALNTWESEGGSIAPEPPSAQATLSPEREQR